MKVAGVILVFDLLHCIKGNYGIWSVGEKRVVKSNAFGEYEVLASYLLLKFKALELTFY